MLEYVSIGGNMLEYVSILDFFKTGELDGIKLGMTMETVEEVLGESVFYTEDTSIHFYAIDGILVYIDISYGRYGTEMTRIAQKLKRRQTDGLCMLLHQAVPGFEQWFGVTPQVDEKLMRHVRTVAESNR